MDLEDVINGSISSSSSVSSIEDSEVMENISRGGVRNDEIDEIDESTMLYICIGLGILIFFGYIAYTKVICKNNEDKSNNNSCCFGNVCS